MTDIVERLRKMASIETSALFSQRKTLNEAATEIEALRRENQELRADCQRTDELLTAAVDDYNDARRLAIEECASLLDCRSGECADHVIASIIDDEAAAIRALTMSDIHREQLGKETT
jgi:hypothetical protein